jgi:DNA-binding CsgD family transcriptional regulator
MVEMGLRAASPVLVGRQDELALLEGCLDAAVTGGSAVALVGGEAGVGKSRLVRELAELARSRGWHVCVGRCLRFGDVSLPLAPLREILDGLVEDLDADALAYVVGNARVVLAALTPGLGAEAGDAAVSGEQLCELAIGVIARLAERQPLTLVFEDLHWADGTTRALFSALAGARRVRPLLLVGTFRSDELPRRDPLRPLLAEVQRGRCERIEVQPLDRAATAELVDAIHGSAVDRAYIDDVHRRSAGNPFFVEELAAAHSSGIGGLPDTLRDVILARAAVLDDAAVDILGVAAAAGSTVSEVLADVSGLGDDALQEVLAELFATALLVPDGDEVRFRHELGREVFYEELLPGRRRSLHARLAESERERRPERAGEVARHWSAAKESARALVASIAAGRQALCSGAAAEAEGHFGRALELWEAVDEASTLTGLDFAGLLLETAIAAMHSAHLDRAIDLARGAVAELANVDASREGEAWLLLRDLYRFTSRWNDCADAVAHALAIIPEFPPSKARVETLAAAAIGDWYTSRPPEEALTHARQAVALAEAVGDRDVVVVAGNALVTALDCAGDYEQALTVSLGNLDRCAVGVTPEHALTAYLDVVNSLTDLGRNSEIPDYAERGVKLARSTGLGGPRSSWIAASWISALVVVGRWTDAEQVLAEVVDLIDHPAQPRGRLACTWGVVLIRQGRLDEARPLIDEARDALFDSSWDHGRAYPAAAIVEFDAAEGHCADAEAVVTECLGTSMLVESDEYLVSRGIAALTDCLHTAPPAVLKRARTRAIATATRWIEHIDAESDDQSLPAWRRIQRDQIAAQFARLQGRSDPQRWARIAAGCAEFGFRYDEALARYRRAEALLAGAGGRASTARGEAGAELAAARSVAADLRAAPLLAEIDNLTRRAGLIHDTDATDSRPEQDEAQNTLGLTARELEVLSLIARGRSNGQIGAELFISTKTASTHVSNIIRKLGVTNRVEAATVAAQHGRDTCCRNIRTPRR